MKKRKSVKYQWNECGASAKIYKYRKEIVMDKKVVRISRRARLLAQQNHIDISKITPTGPDGRIIERDIFRELEKNESLRSQSASLEEMDDNVMENDVLSEETMDKITEEAAENSMAESKTRAMIAVPVKSIVKEEKEQKKDSEPKENEQEQNASYETEMYRHTDVIIPRTDASPNGNPITVTMSFDAGSIVKLNAMVKENGEEMGLSHITINDMILFATAKLLKKNKALNAHFLGDKIRCFEGAHIGFSVDTDHGMETAAVFDADRLSLSALAKITEALIRGARAGKISSEKNKRCASFMITNLGALGVESFTPILKEPQTGVLGVCALQRRIKEVNGKDVAYSCIPLSLTFDPRALDTTSAAEFLRELCKSLENFELLLLK